MRAIDADAVIARVEKDIETAGAVLDGKAPYDVGAQMMFIAREVNACLKEYLAATPTLDIAPVVHGEWIECPTYDDEGYYQEDYKCSECGRFVPAKEPYCHCGAKMDGGKKDGCL